MNPGVVAIGLAAVLALAAPTASAERVRIAAPDGTTLVAHWMPRPGGGFGPAVIALHGCAGLFERTGTAFDPRYPEYASLLHRAGFHVLLPDSFGSRGSGSICALPSGHRRITVEMRRGDALAAIDWLASHPDVDPRRIVLLGWSHGATTTLSALNTARPTYARTIAAAIVFYPGCSTILKEPFRLQAPLLMLLGEKDDWTPPRTCTQLAERTWAAQPDVAFDVHVYSDSHHGFDSTRPVRLWRDVSTGVDPKGVHTGGNPAARAAALREMSAFLDARVGGAQGTSPEPPVAPAIR
ncbi:MAG TPA: dienelactone hydrolase family protein [Burkholderiaceae bacterium]|nr:dienelactone hydrolase family protein [Burkholderiaceae bacterium]